MNSIEELKSEIKKLGIKDNDHENLFKNIADLLLNKFIIKSGLNEYNILEIEFYYCSEKHKDKSTYGFMEDRTKLKKHLVKFKEAQCKQFTWFFHYSGVDIVIGDVPNPGGILIRKIENCISHEVLPGPLIIMLELLNQSISIENGIFSLSLLPKSQSTDIKPIPSIRKGIGKNGNEYKDKLYNFSIDTFATENRSN